MARNCSEADFVLRDFAHFTGVEMYYSSVNQLRGINKKEFILALFDDLYIVIRNGEFLKPIGRFAHKKENKRLLMPDPLDDRDGLHLRDCKLKRTRSRI